MQPVGKVGVADDLGEAPGGVDGFSGVSPQERARVGQVVLAQ